MSSTACSTRGSARHELESHRRQTAVAMTTREIAVEAGGLRAQPRPGTPEIPGVMVAGRKARSPLGDAIRTLGHKPWAMFGLVVLLTWLVVGLLAPVLPIQDPDYQDLSQKLRSPDSLH